MKRKVFPTDALICISLAVLFACSSCKNELVIEDFDGALGKTSAPVLVEVKLDKHQVIAATEGRLGVVNATTDNINKDLIPVQVENSVEGPKSNVVMILPEGGPGSHRFNLVVSDSSFDGIKAHMDDRGQIIIEEGEKKVLQYNYKTVYEKDVIRLDDEKLEEHIRTEKDTFVTTSIYAVPRSDYIHPLYGLEGEMLTRDWPEGGHPHHRAIFWAWPEVEYGSKRGDIYALQKVFARPSGKIEYTGGPVFAEIIAENIWMWENTEPIVREYAVIRVYRATSTSRIIDLTIKLLAMKDSITIATRNTDSYGGLNLRMMTPESQEISYFTDETDTKPLRAWSDFTGIFEGNSSASGLMVLQHQDNPDYPGDWVEVPDLAWVQPTFPASGTRYPLNTENELILRYRLIVHAGGNPGTELSEMRWDVYHATTTPSF